MKKLKKEQQIKDETEKIFKGYIYTKLVQTLALIYCVIAIYETFTGDYPNGSIGMLSLACGFFLLYDFSQAARNQLDQAHDSYPILERKLKNDKFLMRYIKKQKVKNRSTRLLHKIMIPCGLFFFWFFFLMSFVTLHPTVEELTSKVPGYQRTMDGFSLIGFAGIFAIITINRTAHLNSKAVDVIKKT